MPLKNSTGGCGDGTGEVAGSVACEAGVGAIVVGTSVEGGVHVGGAHVGGAHVGT